MARYGHSEERDAETLADREGNAAAIINAIGARELHTFQVGESADGNPTVVALPEGLRLESLRKFEDERLDAPRRIEGTAELTTLQSFTDHVNRFCDGDSAIFANDDMGTPRLLAVFDYHRGTDGAIAEPRFGSHRASYTFPLSNEWKAWVTRMGSWLTQRDFAEFLEAHALDVIAPTDVGDSPAKWATDMGVMLADASTLLDLSRGLSVRVEQKVVQRTNLSTGETQMVFEESHHGKNGGPINIPSGCVVGMPVFKGGDVFQVPARLRHRIREGKVSWAIDFHRLDLVFQTAFNEAVDEVRNATELPVFYGRPEAG